MFLPEEYRALREGAGLVDRSSLGRLWLVGADRRTYLQGLLTNDIVALAPGSGCYAAYLTPQGRMIADMRVFEAGDGLLVDLDGDVAPAVRDRWFQFIFSEDVQLTDITRSTAEVGVYGPRAAEVLSAVVGPSTSAARLASMPVYAHGRWDFAGVPIVILRSDDTGVMGFDVVVPIERKIELQDRLADSGAISVGAGAVETCRVEAGRPVFHVDMDEDTIPLEAGIEDRAISLTKGCYVGQEIIIRVLHRGQGRVARRLVGVILDQSSPVPSRGDRLRVGDRDIGSITSGVFSPARGRPIALGYVHRDYVEAGTLIAVHRPDGAYAGIVSRLPFLDAQLTLEP